MTTNQISAISSTNDTSRIGEVIKLGIDVQIEKYLVVMKIGGSAPERAGKRGHVLNCQQMRQAKGVMSTHVNIRSFLNYCN